jgi:Ca-activated chloride channel family protein
MQVMTTAPRRSIYGAVALLAATLAWLGGPALAQAPQEPAQPTFRSSVAVVPITASVRDARNRIVRDLEREDFQVLEQGQPRRIVDFKGRNDAPVSVAFLFDTSGSMRLALNLEKGIWFIQQFLNQMNAADEAALFTFQKRLRQDVPFTSDTERIHRALGHVNPWGLTSLYDAVAETARLLVDRPAPRRAVVVISDGYDTSSSLTSEQVATLASSIDVPVYVVAVVSRIDETETAPGATPQARRGGRLSDLAQWTGGDLLYVTTPERSIPVTRDLIALMRQQYFMAIESATAPGWYALEVKTKRRGLTVRARRGYFAEAPAMGDQ